MRILYGNIGIKFHWWHSETQYSLEKDTNLRVFSLEMIKLWVNMLLNLSSKSLKEYKVIKLKTALRSII